MRFLLIPLILFLFSLPLTGQNIRDLTELDSGMASATGTPLIASDGKYTATVWVESGTNNLYCSTSWDSGMSWNPAKRIDDAPGGDKKYLADSNLQVRGELIYVCWRDERNGSNKDPFFTYSHDGGNTWSVDDLLDKGGADLCEDLQMAAVSDSVYLAIQTDTSTRADCFFTASHDAGVSWLPIQQLNPGGFTDVEDIAIAAFNDDVFVAYNDDRNVSYREDLFLRASNDHGLTFGSDVQVNLDGDAIQPKIVTEDGTIAIAYQADYTATNPTAEDWLYVSFSHDNGLSFGSHWEVTSGGDVDNHTVAWSGIPLLNIAWEDDRTGTDEIYLETSDSFGASSTEFPYGEGGYPVLGGGRDYMAMTWTGDGHPHTAYLAFTREGGLTQWSSALDLSRGDFAGSDANYAKLSFDLDNRSFHCLFTNNDSGLHRLYVGGARSQSLHFNGSLIGGTSADFENTGFGLSNNGMTFTVVGSFALSGSSLLSDGKILGIVPDIVYYQTYLNPSYMGTIDGAGNGSSPAFVIPPIQSGLTIYFVAGSFDPATLEIGSLTDPIRVDG